MKINLKALNKGVTVIKPNRYDTGYEDIYLLEGKILSFNSAEDYQKYETCCAVFITSGFLEVVQAEDKKEVKSKKLDEAPPVEDKAIVLDEKPKRGRKKLK